MSDKICAVFGAGNEYPDPLIIPDNSVIIAADGGLKKLRELDLTPDFVVGDLDSLDKAPETGMFRLLPHIKDTTDTFEAVQTGKDQNCTEFHIFGGTGGRLDHTLANIQLAAQLSHQGLKAYIYGRNYIITAVTDGKISLPARDHGFVSVFAHSDICTGVGISGLMYKLKDAELENTFALGVSNEFIGKKAVISVKKGTLCVYYEI